MLHREIKKCATEANNFTGGLQNRYNSFSMDVTSTKNFAILDLSIRSIILQPTIKFTKDLLSLHILPKHDHNEYKFDHTSETSAEVNRKVMKKFGFLGDADIRTSDPITTDRASAARGSAEFLSIDANCCGAHFAYSVIIKTLK